MKQVTMPWAKPSYRANIQRFLEEQKRILETLPENSKRRPILVAAIEHTKSVLDKTR